MPFLVCFQGQNFEKPRMIPKAMILQSTHVTEPLLAVEIRARKTILRDLSIRMAVELPYMVLERPRFCEC